VIAVKDWLLLAHPSLPVLSGRTVIIGSVSLACRNQNYTSYWFKNQL